MARVPKAAYPDSCNAWNSRAYGLAPPLSHGIKRGVEENRVDFLQVNEFGEIDFRGGLGTNGGNLPGLNHGVAALFHFEALQDFGGGDELGSSPRVITV